MNLLFLGLACVPATAAGYWVLGRSTPRPTGTWATGSLLASFALALVSYAPVVGHEAGAGAPRIDRLLSNCAVLSAATSALTVCVQINLEPAAARRRVRLYLVLLGAAVTGMTALFAFEQTAHHSPYPYALYLLLFISYLGLAATDLLLQALRHSRSTRNRSVRVGMRLVAAGCACAILHTGYKCAVLVSLFPGIRITAAGSHRSSALDLPHLLSGTAPALAALLICLGLTLPAVAYPVGQARRHRWEVRSLAALGPLWHDLSRAMPEIVLPTAASEDAADESDFLLHRRVIEIDDAILALRPYRSRSVQESAQRIADPTTEHGAAVIEAAVIAAALVSFRAGHPATGPAPSPSPDASSRKDLRADAEWLLQVAEAYGHRLPQGG